MHIEHETKSDKNTKLAPLVKTGIPTVVTLVLNNLVEKTFIYNNEEQAEAKFINLCEEFCSNWDEFDDELVIATGYLKFDEVGGGSINLSKPANG